MENREITRLLERYDAVYVDTNILLKPAKIGELLSALRGWLHAGNRLRVRKSVMDELHKFLKREELREVAEAALALLMSRTDALVVEESVTACWMADIDFFALFAEHCETRNQLLITEDAKLQSCIQRIDCHIKSAESPYVTHAARLVQGTPALVCCRDEEMEEALKNYSVYVDASFINHPQSISFLQRVEGALRSLKKPLHVLYETRQRVSEPERQTYIGRLPSAQRVGESQQRSERVALCVEMVMQSRPLLITSDAELAKALRCAWPTPVDRCLSPLTVWLISPDAEPALPQKPAPALPQVPPSLAQQTAAPEQKPAALPDTKDALAEALPLYSPSMVARCIDRAIREMRGSELKLLAECPQLASGVGAAYVILIQWLKTHISKQKGANSAFRHPSAKQCFRLALSSVPPDSLALMENFIEAHLKEIDKETTKAATRAAIWEACLAARDAGVCWPEARAEQVRTQYGLV